MKNSFTFFYYLLICFILFSCQKDFNTVTDTTQVNTIGNFTVTVQNRLPTEAKINWTRPSVTSILYKVYLGSNLITQNLVDTSYQVINLQPNLVYQGRVVAYTSTGDSSSALFSLPTVSTTNIIDSIFLLSDIGNNSGLHVSFTYDEANKRYSSWQFYYNAVNNDSTILNYDANNKITSVLRKTPSSNSSYRHTAHIFEYTNGLVTKIYHKNYKEFSPQFISLFQQYLTTVNFPLTVSEVESYDSINYINNKISSIYNFRLNSSPPLSFLLNYNKFIYSAQNDSLLQNIQEFSRLGYTDTFTLANFNILSYSNKANPYYYGLNKVYPLLCSKISYTTSILTFPYYLAGYAPINRYLVTNPYLCTNYNNTNGNINYSYNSDSLVNRCWWASNTLDYTNFFYNKIKK